MHHPATSSDFCSSKAALRRSQATEVHVHVPIRFCTYRQTRQDPSVRQENPPPRLTSACHPPLGQFPLMNLLSQRDAYGMPEFHARKKLRTQGLGSHRARGKKNPSMSINPQPFRSSYTTACLQVQNFWGLVVGCSMQTAAQAQQRNPAWWKLGWGCRPHQH